MQLKMVCDILKFPQSESWFNITLTTKFFSFIIPNFLYYLDVAKWTLWNIFSHSILKTSLWAINAVSIYFLERERDGEYFISQVSSEKSKLIGYKRKCIMRNCLIWLWRLRSPMIYCLKVGHLGKPVVLLQ